MTEDQLKEAATAVAVALERYPTLGCLGFNGQPDDLLAHKFGAAGVATAIGFLRTCRRTRLPRMGSYALKHRAENWGRDHGMSAYVANGELIVAAVYLGFTVHPHKGSPNATINAADNAWVRRWVR